MRAQDLVRKALIGRVASGGPVGSELVEPDRLLKRLERERLARAEAESIAEKTTRELYEKQRELDLLQKIAVAANESTSFQEALQFAITQVCLHTSWPVGHVYLPGGPAASLTPAPIWHLDPPGRFELFRSVTEATPLARGVGLPGRVWSSGQPAWIRDVTQDSNFPRARAARDIGVRSGFAFPVWLGGEVLAVLEFFSAEIEEPGSRFLEDISHIGTQLARVAERERAAEALRATGEHYRLLFESNPQCMWVFDRETLAFLAVNSAACRHYGYPADEFLRMTIKDIRPPEEIPALLEGVARAETNVHQAGTWKHRTKDGSVIDVEIRSSDLPLGGRSARLVLANDVTERKKLEQQLRQSQKMEAVGRLAGGVAHDFNNVLTAILGYSDLALARLDPQSPIRRTVGEIRKAAQRAASLTRQLLAFSRQQILQPRVVDLNTVVTDMESMLRRLIGEDICFMTHLEPRLAKVKADPGQLEQVIMNLGVNARDAMPGGGVLTIETANVEVDDAYARQHVSFQPGSYVLLAITDNGCGMDEKTRARIFEPFFTTKELGQGTGLGLSTVYGIVKQTGGYIWVYSEVGRGTTFKIYLPLAGEAASVSEQAETPACSLDGSETILLVEDDEVVRDIARTILRMRGYTVLVASSGVEALRIAFEREEPIDLVLSDVVMPGMNGREVVLRLSQMRPVIKSLFTSGYTQYGAVEPAGFDAECSFLQKPYTAQTLARKVREVLDAGSAGTAQPPSTCDQA